MNIIVKKCSDVVQNIGSSLGVMDESFIWEGRVHFHLSHQTLYDPQSLNRNLF